MTALRENVLVGAGAFSALAGVAAANQKYIAAFLLLAGGAALFVVARRLSRHIPVVYGKPLVMNSTSAVQMLEEIFGTKPINSEELVIALITLGVLRKPDDDPTGGPT